MSFPVPANEVRRLEALKRYELLDTGSEQTFDDFAQLASYICETPTALISLLDANRQWFKARVGMEAIETPREQAFCSHTIMGTDLMVVEDAKEDPRFSKNPLVTAGPLIRFYAGAPLVDREGFGLGSLCVIDQKPRQLKPAQEAALYQLARQVVAQFEYRRLTKQFAEILADMKTLRTLLPICAHCKSIRNDKGYWNSVEEYIVSHGDAMLSHGVCPDCLRVHYPDMCDDILAAASTAPGVRSVA